MRRAWLAAALIFMSAGVSAGWKAPQSPVSSTAPQSDYRELLNRYCITCHNQRAKIPAGAPLYLDQANLNDPAADAAA